MDLSMADLQDFLSSMDDLSREEQLVLRAALDARLGISASPPGSSSRLIGLFADDSRDLDRLREEIAEN
jgi:hypothetical protein